MYKFKTFVIKEIVPSNLRKSCAIPVGRSGHRIVCDENSLYSYGGFNPTVPEENLIGNDSWDVNKPLFKELWKLNLSTRMWERVAYGEALPNELASNSVLLSGRLLIIFGGTGFPFGLSNCTNAVKVCNLSRNSMIREIEVTGCSPPKQYGQAMIIDGTYLYTVGGTSGFEYSADVHRLDLCNRFWEEMYICKGKYNHEPEGRYRHEIAFDGINIYILGGGTASNTFDFERIYVFNIINRRWTEIHSLADPATCQGYPGPRRCHGCIQLKDSATVFICGGYDGVTCYSDVWKLELKSLQWTCISKCVLPEPLYFHSVSVTPAGCMYSFGGVITRGDTHVRTNQLYTTWLCIPKLSEICWEALLHYACDISSYSREHLIQLGVPLNFVNRLDLKL